jgi:hypothetical protein
MLPSAIVLSSWKPNSHREDYFASCGIMGFKCVQRVSLYSIYRMRKLVSLPRPVIWKKAVGNMSML